MTIKALGSASFTNQALQVEATRQTLHAQGTATAQAFRVKATRAAVVAEQDRLQAERERLAQLATTPALIQVSEMGWDPSMDVE